MEYQQALPKPFARMLLVEHPRPPYALAVVGCIPPSAAVRIGLFRTVSEEK